MVTVLVSLMIGTINRNNYCKTLCYILEAILRILIVWVQIFIKIILII